MKYEMTGNSITESLIVGFILYKVVGKLFVNNVPNAIFLIFFSAVAGYICSRTVSSNLFSSIMRKLKIYKTSNKHIWEDMFSHEESTMIQVYDKEKDNIYLGVLCLIEEFERQPIVVLCRYSVYDSQGNEIVNYENDPTKRILIDTSKYPIINFFYEEDSKITIKERQAISTLKK